MKIQNRKNNFEKDKNSVTLYHAGCCSCCCCCLNTIGTSIYSYKTFLKGKKYRAWWTLFILLLAGIVDFIGGWYLLSINMLFPYLIGSIILNIIYILAINNHKKSLSKTKRSIKIKLS